MSFARSDSAMRASTSSARAQPSLSADAVQGCMVDQVLDHGEIEIERARLEYHADHAQRLARCVSDIVAENPDAAALDAHKDA